MRGVFKPGYSGSGCSDVHGGIPIRVRDHVTACTRKFEDRAMASVVAEMAGFRGGCDRAIPNPNRLIEYLSYKIKHLLKNTVLLYSPGSHASPLNAGLGAEKLWQFCIATTI
jgi:hypothetical protein